MTEEFNDGRYMFARCVSFIVGVVAGAPGMGLAS